MRTILHLSDLHFGRIDPEAVAALGRIAGTLAPDVVAVSGDLTQRARPPEFIAARDFLAGLPGAKVIVPGNHDVPLYNVFARFLAPLARFREYIGDETRQRFSDREVTVVGVNTARSLVVKGGRINMEQVGRACRAFEGTPGVRVLVTHHPFDLPTTGSARDLVGRAGRALASFGGCMPDVLLAGHLHAHGVGTTVDRHDLGGTTAIVVQAGTATSTRGRGEANSFNVLRVDGPAVTVQRYMYDSTRREFEPGTTHDYARDGARWVSRD